VGPSSAISFKTLLPNPMKYKVIDALWYDGKRYEIGAEVEMDEAQAAKLTGVVEAVPQTKAPKDKES
jgi:hypothetical protein